jgi:PTH1 family peptidyl-tRNA hydrolase
VKLVVGLGNPGPEYKHSPHNMGFAVVDRLAERHGVGLSRRRAHSLCGHFVLGSEKIWLIQPQTFMNHSGVAVAEWFRKEGSGPEDLVVLADELDLPWGTIQIRQRGGSAGHHGLESIMDAIGTKVFTRMRIGVEPGRKLDDPVSYLLRPMRSEQRRSAEGIVSRAADAAEMILQEGPAQAMNRFNRRDALAEAPPPASAR